jgi:hypothetical protein
MFMRSPNMPRIRIVSCGSALRHTDLRTGNTCVIAVLRCALGEDCAGQLLLACVFSLGTS